MLNEIRDEARKQLATAERQIEVVLTNQAMPSMLVSSPQSDEPGGYIA
jgi:hypothetical protein